MTVFLGAARSSASPRAGRPSATVRPRVKCGCAI